MDSGCLESRLAGNMLSRIVADGICFVCLLGFVVHFWVLHCVLLCSSKRLSSRGRRAASLLSGSSYYLGLVKFSQWRKYPIFYDNSGLWSTAMLFWRSGWKNQGVKLQGSWSTSRDNEGFLQKKKADKLVMFVCSVTIWK